MDLLTARRHRNPGGPSFVRGAVASSDRVVEAFRCRHDRLNRKLALAGESLLRSDIDVGWLPAAAETYAVSSDPRDYVLVDIPIVTVDVPNRNLQAFPYEEVSYFDPLYGRMVYQSFDRKPCLTGDTLVSTDKGVLPLDQLSHENSAWVATRTGKARIKKWWPSGHKTVVTMTTRSGTQLTGTRDHPVLVLTANLILKWKDLGGLEVGDHVVVRNRSNLVESNCDLKFALIPVRMIHDETYVQANAFGKRSATIRRWPPYRRTPMFPTVMTNELARVLGYLVSEGSVGKHVQFCNTDVQLVDDYRSCWRACFDEDLSATPSKTPSGGNGWMVSTGKADVAAWLSAVGLPACVAQTKRVPFSIFKSSRAPVLHFLAAYIEGDGCASGRLQMHSTSRALLHDIKLLLETFWGVQPCLSLQRPAKGPRSDLWCLRLTAHESKALVAELPFVSQHRLEQAAAIESKQIRDRGIPYVRDYAVAKVSQHAVGRGRSRKYYDQHGQLVAGSIQVRAGTTATQTQAKKWCGPHVLDVAAQLKKLNPEYGQRLRNLVGDFYFDEVVNVSTPSVLHHPVYDIETTASQFVANNVVVHNCHQDHDNKDPLKAKGVMFDSTLRYVPAYNVWKISILAGWDRTKDPWLVRQILSKKRTGYSMGALVEAFVPLASGTRVFTEHGIVPIESVRAGTQVMTVHGLKPSGGAVFNDYLPTMTIETDAGMSMTPAPNHPVLVLRPDLSTAWVEAGDLAVDDFIAVSAKEGVWPERLPFDYVPLADEVDENGMAACAICDQRFGHIGKHVRSTHRMSLEDYTERHGRRVMNPTNLRTDIRYPDEMTPELAALLGYFVAEGSWGDSDVLSPFANTNPELCRHYAECLEAVFGIEPPRTVGLPLGIKDFYRYLGIAHGYAADKHVPWSIFQAPRECVAAFLRAYWEGDGSARWAPGAVTFHTTSQQLAQDIQLLLLGFGIPSQRTATQQRAPYRALQTVALWGTHVDRFVNEIGCTSEVRRRDLDAAITKRNITQYGETIPHGLAALRELYDRAHVGKPGNPWYVTTSGKKEKVSLHRLDFKDNSQLAYGHFERWDDLLPNIRKLDEQLAERFAGLCDSRLTWARVTHKSISHVLQPCYCIRDVEEGHNFLAEGYVVHNCSVCGAIDTNVRKCACMKKGKGQVTASNRLTFQQCCGVNFIECSSVDDPADITADTDAILE